MRTFVGVRPSAQDCTLCLVLFLVAFAVRCLFLIFLDEPILFFKYPFFAEKLAAGIDIKERIVDLSPFYLYFLTLLKRVFGLDWLLVKPVQSFVGALNCLLVFIVGSQAFGKGVGVVAACLLAAYGNLIILESTLEPTVFVLLFNLLCVYFLFQLRLHLSQASLRLSLAAASGFFAGLSIITKPNFMLFVPVAAVWMLIVGPNQAEIAKRFQAALVFCCMAFLVVLPITVRNYVRLGDFVLVTADAGKVFYHGNGKGATALEGTGLPDEGFMEESGEEPDYAHVLFRKTASKLRGKDLLPSESSRFWMERALADIRSDPVAYMLLEAKKLIYFFHDYEMHYIASAYEEYKRSLSLPFVRYGLIASLGLLGMVFSVTRFKELFPLYGVVFVYLLSCLLFRVQSRYRIPAVPYLCLFAGYSVYAMRDMVAARRFRQVGLALVVTFLLFVSTHVAFKNEVLKVDRWQQATKIHYQMGAVPHFKGGRYREAISELNACVAMTPNFSPAYNLMGRSHAILGEYSQAISNFHRVIELSPGVPDGYRNLGFIYLLQGDRAEAATLLSKALSLNPNDDSVKQAVEELKSAEGQS